MTKFFENILNKIPGLNGTYSNFYEAALPVYKVSSKFGFLPFQFNSKRKNKPVYVSLKDLVRFSIALIVYVSCAFLVLLEQVGVKHNSIIIVHGIRFTIFNGLLMAILSAILGMIYRKTIGFMLEEVYDIDEKVFIFFFI